MMNIDQYLQRINYAGSRNPTVETLRGLHRAHMLAVPFENLSIHSGERIQLNHEWLFEKIVTRHRGGFCYECNGLFAWLLGELGFQVTLLSARVRNSVGDGFGPEFDHLILKIDLQEPWLADVGFGDSFLEPIKLQINAEQNDAAGTFRIQESGNGFVLEEQDKDVWQPQHFFSLTPRTLDEFKEMCHHHQTTRDSPFRKKWLVTIARIDGRTTLTAGQHIVTRNGIREELTYRPSEIYTLLKQVFGIEGVTLEQTQPL
jgi:N-hydroxyarylamine O-acetyltransferase